MKKNTRDKNPVDDDVSRKIHIGDGSGIQPQGDDGAPGVGDAKQIVESKEIIDHEGGGGNEYAPGSKEERNKGKKPVEYIVSTIVHDGKTTSVGEHGKQVHEADPVTNVEGSSSHSPGDGTSIEKDGGIREGDDDYEEGEVREGDAGYEERQVDIMEDGDNQNKSNRGKKPLDIDINVYDGKQVHEAELVTNVAGSSRHSPLDTAIETKNDEYSEGGFQEQVVAMEDVGGDENNNRNSERVDDGVSTMVHDGVSGGEQVRMADPVMNLEERSYHAPVYATIENMNDGNSLEDNHEMEQQIAMNDVGDGSSGINAIVGENQDKKGKRPIEYVACPIIQDGASGSGGKEPESNDNNAPIVTDRERLELELAELLTIPVRILKELECLSNASHVGGEGGVHGGPPTNLTLGRSSDAIHESNHDDQMQEAAPEVPDGGNDNDIAIPHGHMPTQGGGEIIMLDPLIIRTQKRSIHELGEVSQQRPKHGCDGGFGRSRWVRNANDHRLRLFGIDIPHVEEHEEVEIMQQQQHPKPIVVLRLLGFDIEVPEEELQASATEIRDGASRENHAPGGHGGGELSMQQPKYGLRLMGIDL